MKILDRLKEKAKETKETKAAILDEYAKLKSGKKLTTAQRLDRLEKLHGIQD